VISRKDSNKEIIVNCIICVISGIILIGMCFFRILGAVDDRIYDAFLGVSAGGPLEAESTGIVLVTIDEESMAEVGKRWPWDRRLFAKTIDYLSEAGAKAIGLDLLFVEGSADADSDLALADSMKKSGNVVIASKLEYLNRSFASDSMSFSGNRLVLPQPVFRTVSSTGIVNLEYGTGSIIRQFKPFYMHQGERFPSFATEIYRNAFEKLPDLADSGMGFIYYFGVPGSFPSVPIYQVLNGMAKKEMFKNKIVLVGATFSDSHDFFATPISASAHPSPGMEVQANILGTLAKKSNIEYMPQLPQMIIIMTLVCIAGYLAMFRSAYFLWAAFAISSTLIISLSIWLIYRHEIILDVSYPLAAIPLTFFMVSLRMRKTLVLETKIGPYILHEELGRGGMAVVYRATHPRTGEEVALKQLLPQFTADEQSLARFVMETDMLRQLAHPNIIRIIDAGDVNKCPYYAMELIKGPSLDRVMKEKGRLSNTEVRQIGGAVARALARAHEAGVIHRDIKPSNIMLTNTGIPKLTDFGIAKQLDSPHLTMTGMIIGTPAYLAPETCNGKSANSASDIYSFGATLYAMLCGRPPFAGDNIHSVISQVVNKPAPDICTFCSTVEDELSHLVMRCLEKDPAKRPESMIEVAKILDPYYTDMALKHTSATEHPIPTFYDDKTIETSSIDNGDKTVPMTGVARTPNSKSSHPTG
jgi:serine/threonine protein kinase/CHASE2 domain-containing sensor protein